MGSSSAENADRGIGVADTWSGRRQVMSAGGIEGQVVTSELAPCAGWVVSQQLVAALELSLEADDEAGQGSALEDDDEVSWAMAGAVNATNSRAAMSLMGSSVGWRRKLRGSEGFRAELPADQRRHRGLFPA
jgi:hypothetical protein